MKISLEWLNELVASPWDAAELAQRLTMAGLEVESVEREADRFANIVVGEVRERVKHPNADSLSVCQVSTGTEILEIVCGAPNVAAGQKVAVALIGAQLGEITLAKRKIRGIVSNGMICSAKELGLGEDHAGIMTLAADAKAGQPFSEYLGLTDTIFEIGVTPNRGDALSHIGVARDVAALAGATVRKPEPKAVESKNVNIDSLARVEVRDADACPRYCARVVCGVNVGESPAWLKRRLQRLGLRPINTIVDVTNYVLMECGHPLHAFDYDALEGHAIIVRRAAEGETFVTLDNARRTLRADTLLICDANRGVAIAGVMGGKNSEITPATKNVLIESAYFDPPSIRRTSKFLGVSTDSSYRFERGTDVENTIYAVNRAAELMRELAGGGIAAGIIDAYPQKISPRTITVRFARVNALLGAVMSDDEITGFAGRLGLAPHRISPAEFGCAAPSYRPDIESEIDVIEEIARIAGYDRFAPKAPYIPVHLPMRSAPPQADIRDKIRGALAARGFSEIVANSLIDERRAALFSDAVVRLANPLSAEMAVVRPHPLPPLLGVIAHNLRLGARDVRIFERARAYERGGANDTDVEKRFREREWLAFAACGAAAPEWNRHARPYDFYDLKGAAEGVCRTAGFGNYRIIPYNTVIKSVFSSASASIVRDGREVGVVGTIARNILNEYDIGSGVYAALLDIEALCAGVKRARYEPPSRFPSIARDLAVVAPAGASAVDVQAAIVRAAASPLLRAVRIFDVFEGGALGADARSMAFSLEFAAPDRTLRDDEVARVMSKIMSELEKRYHYTIRS